MGKSREAKKNVSKALSISHPNSRKAVRLAKQSIKEASRRKTKVSYAIRKNMFGVKLMWFHDNLNFDGDILPPSKLDQLFEKYLSRFNNELEQISIKHSIGKRKNRQHANREDVIKITLANEAEEYNTFGMEMVDILHPKQLKIFKEWDGDVGKMNNFVIKRFTKSFLQNYKSPEHQKPPGENREQPSEEAEVEKREISSMETDDKN